MSVPSQHQQWLERQIRRHTLWQILLIGAWVASIVAVFLLFTLGVPWFRERLELPEIVLGVMGGGVALELLILILISAIVTLNKRRLQREFNRLSSREHHRIPLS